MADLRLGRDEPKVLGVVESSAAVRQLTPTNTDTKQEPTTAIRATPKLEPRSISGTKRVVGGKAAQRSAATGWSALTEGAQRPKSPN